MPTTIKKLFIKSSLLIASVASLSLFVSGFLWSLVPLGGVTLPHWLESASGLSFNGAALLISILLGVTCVSSITLPYTFQRMETARQKAKS